MEKSMGKSGDVVQDLNLCTVIKHMAVWINCMSVGNYQDDNGK